MATYVNSGEVIPYTPEGAITAGDVVTQNGCVGIVVADTEAGQLGGLRIEGVYEFDTSDSLDVGEKVYWDSGAEEATSDPDSGANGYLGRVSEESASSLVRVKINVLDGMTTDES